MAKAMSPVAAGATLPHPASLPQPSVRVALEMADGSIVAGVIARELHDRYVLRDSSVLVVGGDDTTVDTAAARKTLVVRVHPLGAASVVA